MKKIALLLTMTLGLMATIQAQDAEATRLLDQLKTKFDSFKSMEAGFTLELDLPEREAEIQEGKIIQAGDKYYLDLADQAVYNDGTNLWVHLKSNKEVQLSEAEFDEGDQMMSPKEMVKLYESQEYDYAITNSQKVAGKTMVDIEFKPLDRDSEYTKMRMTVNKTDNMMKKMIIFARDGSRYSVTLGDLVANKSYDDKIFAFDKAAHPGVHVEDLRID